MRRELLQDCYQCSACATSDQQRIGKFMIFSWVLFILGGLLIVFGGLPGIAFGGAAVFFGYKLQQKRKTKQNNIKDLNQSALADADYSHVFEDYAMAVSEKNRQVYLAAGGHSKTYDFSDIRRWHYNLESGGAIIGGGMAVAAMNVRQGRQNEENSGFFVQVKDVDHPEWQIRFPYNKDLKKNLLRWMEIFEQKVNNQ
ncbi:DUF4755 domain-containing protein [Duganella alba]|nr:DUF4755 domain-containing protein [Duganella alba]